MLLAFEDVRKGDAMNGIYGWVRNIICCLCILELLYHIVQNPDYQKYLRFFGGIVFMLITLSPLLDVLKIQGRFDTMLQNALLQEEIWELRETADSLAGLQNEKIETAYVQELERQMASIVRGHNRIPLEEKVTLETVGSGEQKIAKVELCLTAGHLADEDLKGQMEQELSEDTAIEAVKSEICAMYGIEKEQVFITVKE